MVTTLVIEVKDKQESILKANGEFTTTHENDILSNQDVQFPCGMFFLNESYFYEPHYTYTSMHFLIVGPIYNDQLIKKINIILVYFCIEGSCY
jgi:hypothetical protein